MDIKLNEFGVKALQARNDYLLQERDRLARRVVELEQSQKGEAIGWLTNAALNELQRGHPAKLYAPDNLWAPGDVQNFVYLHPPAPVAVPEYKQIEQGEHTKSKRYKDGWNDCRQDMIDNHQAALFRAHSEGTD